MLEEKVSTEVKAFLSVFDGWVSGREDLDWDNDLVARLRLEGTYVTRNGIVQTLGELSDEVRQAQAANPDYCVKPGRVRIVDAWEQRIVVLYEERTSGSRLGPTSEFVRLVTAVLQEDTAAPGGFRWIHIHESQHDV